MNIRAAMQQYIKTHPGLPLRSIVTGIGLSDRAAITTASAQLCQLVAKGQLRAEPNPSGRRGMLYHPTPLTGVNLRRQAAPQEVQAARAKAKAERRRRPGRSGPGSASSPTRSTPRSTASDAGAILTQGEHLS